MPVMRINVGPIHPSTHGVLRLLVDVDGDTIENMTCHIGFLHRGVEKLMENRMYMQSPSYTEKLDYVAPLGWDDLYVHTVELALQKEVKETAKYARVIIMEFQRIASHLFFIGALCNDIGQMFTMFMWAFRERDAVLKFLEDVSGSRMFYVNMRVGGLMRPLPDDFYDRAYKLTEYIAYKVKGYKDVIDDNSIFMERTKGIGTISKKEAIDFGLSGPNLRASGVEYDVRKKYPYYAYDKLKFKVPTSNIGDGYARYKMRYEEIFESIKIIRQALDKMPKDNDVVGLPIKLIGPEAKPDIVINHHELPRGEGIIYMVPDKQKPYRIRLRSPVFISLSALEHICKGAKFADLFSIAGTLDVVMAEVDR